MNSSVATHVNPRLLPLSRFIKDFLDSRSISAAAVVQASGLGKSTVYAVLNAQQEPMTQTLEKLAIGLSRVSGESVTATALRNLIRTSENIDQDGYVTPEMQAKYKRGTLIELMRSEPLPDVMDAVAVGIERLQRSGIASKASLPQISTGGKMQGHTLEQKRSMAKSILSYLLLGLLTRRGIDRLTLVSRCGDPLSLSRIDEIIDEGVEPTDDEYRSLARGINDLDNNDFQWWMLKQLFATPVVTESSEENGIENGDTKPNGI